MTERDGDPRPPVAQGGHDAPTIDEFYERASCGYVSMRTDGEIVRVNETFVKWTGRTREALLEGQHFSDLLTVGSRLYFETHCAPMLAAGLELREVALDLRRADGSIVLALLGATVHGGEEGRPPVVRLTIFDASHRRGFERHLLAERDADRRGREQAEALSRISDRLAMLETTQQVTGALAGELVGGGFAKTAELVLRTTAATPLSEARFSTASDGASTVAQLPVRSGTEEVLGTLHVEVAGPTDDIDRAFLQAAADVAGRAVGRTQRTAAKARATRPSGTSGLPNERWWAAALKSTLQQSAEYRTPACVAVVEIAHLEEITMTQGIGAADRLLIAVSDAWRDAGFDLLSRFGGEEFGVLMPGHDLARGKAAVARAKRSAGTTRVFSVGLVQWDGRESAVSLMSRAERALLSEPH